MTKEQAIEYIKKNRKLLSLREIAERIGYDVSNFHKVINGTLNLPDIKLKELNKIIKELQLKEKK
jgi:predicted transcriptional regulator